tara:strand:- start:37 stop:411 length:375 start_codon:yes stop_codon:yes gene_type:complete
MKLLKQCTLDGVTRRKDKSLKISFITSLEQSSTELMEVDKLLDTNGILYFKDSEGLSTDEINQIDKVVLDKPSGKSKSERLRNALYILCKQKKGSDPKKEEFAEWYSNKMEKFIQHVIGQLDEV